MTPVAVLLILAVGGASASVWEDMPSARKHVSTGLTFPDQIDGLRRMPIASPSTSTNEVDISYASEGTTRLRITLTPLLKGKEPDLQGALKDRIRSRAASPPYEWAPVFPVLCNSEEVTFAYRTLAQTSGGNVEPPTGYLFDRTVVVTSSGSVERPTGYPSDAGPVDWWFAAALLGHLVVIESQISRHADLYYGADRALRDLLDPLGWPCRLPPSKLEQAAQRKKELEIRRRTPPERTPQQSASILRALATPIEPFDESSTLGPRPVRRDPAPGSYAHARSTGRPHTCETSAPSFFGEREEYVAYVEGDDFVASGPDKMHFARVNGVAYTWSDDPLIEVFGVLLGRIRLAAYEDAYKRLMHHPPPRWENIFVFVEPADSDTCTPAKRQKLTIPNRGLRDMTDDLIAGLRKEFEASVETLMKLPFAPRLPHPSLIDLFPATRGGAGANGYYVEYLAHGAGPNGESSELSIGFRAHTSEEPASQCGESWIGRRVCEHVATTARGLEVFRELSVLGGSGNLRLPHYYAKVGDALVNLKYIYWSHGPRGATGWRAHEFAPGELEAVFDSLQPVAAEDVVRFPGMRVGE